MNISEVLNLSCRRATRIISESMERDLTLRERVALRLHQCLCTGCRRFQRHMRILRSIMAQWFAAAEGEEPERLSEAARTRIADRLQREWPA